MSNTIDGLILLIGTNPLPNFVVAHYLLTCQPGLKDIYLLYSEETSSQGGTKMYAENIQSLLQSVHQKAGLRFHQIHLSDISSAIEIWRNLKDRLMVHLQSNNSIHLNYTGGTKAMGIHVYRWLEEHVREKDLKASFSYLDARTFQIVDDKAGRVTTDLRDHIKIGLDDLLALHGFEKVPRQQTDGHFVSSPALEKFKGLIDEDRLEDYFKDYNREAFVGDKGLLTKAKDVRERITEKAFSAKGVFLEIVKRLPQDYRHFNDDGTFREPKNNKILAQVIEFLDGKWLEQYIYEVLNRRLPKGDFSAYTNCEIRRPQWQSPNQRFELDVLLLKGYQLIGISCTTSHHRPLCKSKGFEIFMRTRQIGGEEARAALVTRLSEGYRDGLQEELEIDTGGRGNILVLGANDLKEDLLVQKISDFIN